MVGAIVSIIFGIVFTFLIYIHVSIEVSKDRKRAIIKKRKQERWDAHEEELKYRKVSGRDKEEFLRNYNAEIKRVADLKERLTKEDNKLIGSKSQSSGDEDLFDILHEDQVMSERGRHIAYHRFDNW